METPLAGGLQRAGCLSYERVGQVEQMVDGVADVDEARTPVEEWDTSLEIAPSSAVRHLGQVLERRPVVLQLDPFVAGQRPSCVGLQCVGVQWCDVEAHAGTPVNDHTSSS